ncbi:hypothetical protein ABPG75_008062 [Micractinium tetrahymenae]
MLQLLVFDARRGNTEGQEDDKVLAWYPPGLPPAHQSGLAGLLHGLLLFTASFTGAQRPRFDCAETDSGTWVLHEAEPHIWFAALAPRAWLPRHAGEHNLRSVLAQAHLLTTVLCGSVQCMLDQDPEGSLARLSLQAVLHQAGQHLGSPHSWQHRELRNPLMDVSLPPMLALPPHVALGVQSLANLMQQAALGGRRPVAGVMLLYGPHLLWSSLPPRDTAALFALLATGLLHASSSSSSAGGSAGGPTSTPSHSSSSNANGAAGGVARSDLRPLHGGAWQQLPSGFLVQRGSGITPDSSGSGGGAGDPAGTPAVSVPVVYLQQRPLGQQAQQAQQAGRDGQLAGADCSGEPAGDGLQLHPYHLLPLLEGKLLVALLLGGGTRLLAPPLLGGLHALLAAPAKQLAAQIGEELRASRTEAAHLPGFRYLYQDLGQQAARASPRAKVSAMSHHARTLAAAVRDSLGQLQAEGCSSGAGAAAAGGSGAAAAAAGDGGGGSDAGGDVQALKAAAAPGESPAQGGLSSSGLGTSAKATVQPGDHEILEVLAKSSQECWAAAWRPGGGRQLLAVRERRSEREPAEAAEVMQAFAATHFHI